jgi:hypothetical protein
MTFYDNLVYLHILLFVFWLGGDLGVYILGQQFRKRHEFSLETRLVLLKTLVICDMGPRTAWCLMVPVSLSMVQAGGYWPDMPGWIAPLSWVIGLGWLWLVWDAHWHDQTPRAARDRKIEDWLKYALTVGYLWLGVQSVITGHPLEPDWLAWKAVLFGVIFAAAIMIDVAFRPVGPLLGRLIAEGSTDSVEVPLRQVMDRTGMWVKSVYVLLAIIAWMGNAKPF